jgi:RND family efflux transporter MFP subunit
VPRHVFFLIGLCGAIAVAGCSGDAAPERAEGSQPIPVRIATVEARDEPVTIEATGSFQAAETSEVAPEASGRVLGTPVDVGDTVKAGQVLVTIQAVDAKLRLEEARAAAQRAEANLALARSEDELARVMAERQVKLLDSGHVSRSIADEARTRAETAAQRVATAQASLAEARAQLALADKALTDVTVRAPFDGQVSARHVSPGEYVQPSTPVVTLVKTHPLRLNLAIPGVQAGQVARGLRVEATVDAYPDRMFAGEITAVNPVIAPESRSFVVEVSVPNAQAVLKPGMFAVATINQGTTTRALFVPRAAVMEDVNTDSWRAYVIDDRNQARLRVVQLAPRQEGDTLRLLGGVAEGERVAVSNLGELYDTAPVTVEGADHTDAASSGGSATRSAR